MTIYGLSRKALLNQILLALCSSVGFLATGLVRGYSSPGIPSMNKTDPWLLPDEWYIASAESWITAIPPLGSVVGCMIAMPWMHYMGRKRVIQIVASFFTLSWFGLALSHSTESVILLRFLNGIAGGVTVPSVQVYVSECSHPKIRGLLASLPSALMVLGVLVQTFFGLIWEWRGMAWASSVFPVALIIFLIPFPESPPWLKLNGKKNYNEAYEWFGIRPDLEHARQLEEVDIALTPDGVKADRKSFCSRGVLVPLWLAFSTIIFQQTCGNDIIIYKTVDLFRSSGSTLNAYTSSVIVNVVHFIFVIISIFLVDKFGRKKLLMFSAFFMGLSMSVLSIHFYLHGRGLCGSISFLPLVSVVSYIATYSLGFCTVPLVLFGEIFPLAYRSLLGPLTMSVGVLAMFIELITFDGLADRVGKDGAFALYSFFNFFAVVYIFFFLPETKGKSLEEIEVFFSKSPKRKVKSTRQR